MKIDIARAWKDENYRNSLSSEEQAQLPQNPVGELELSDADLEGVYGGRGQRISYRGDCITVQANNCHSNGGNCLTVAANNCYSNYGICSFMDCSGY